ncbi:hypothetical protein [Streptomyces sp. NPDC057002]|uniref:hypothetical protein n=1 Tax=Streptomyces sp. NPDC057002 TaxID=3345992 RepID=UPI003630C395
MLSPACSRKPWTTAPNVRRLSDDSGSIAPSTTVGHLRRHGYGTSPVLSSPSPRTLHGWGIPHGSDASETVVLIVAELATNAVTHGRVLLVDALADRWEVLRREPGKTVRAEVDLPGTVP